jgi:hypothetical protein
VENQAVLCGRLSVFSFFYGVCYIPRPMPAPSSSQSAQPVKRPRGREPFTAEQREAEIAASERDQSYILAERLRLARLEANP